MATPLSRSERDARWQKLVQTFPRVPAKLAFEMGSTRGPQMRHGTSLLACQYSLDTANLIAAGGGRLPGCDSAIRVFDSATGDESLICRGHICGIYDLAIQPHTGFLASASEDYSVILWNLEKQDAIFVAGGDPIVKGHVAFTTEKNWLVIGEKEAYEDFVNSVFVIDLDSGKEVFRQTLRHSKEVAGLTISENGESLFVALANHQGSPIGTDVYCWDLGVRSQENWFVTMCRKLFTSDRATGGKCVWKKTMNDVNILELHTLPGQQRLVAAIREESDGYRAGICVLDAQTGNVLAKEVRSDHWASVAVSPDGSTAAIAYGEGGLELVHISALALVKILADKGQRFASVQFSPDGKTVLAGASLHDPELGTQGELKLFGI